MHRSTVPASKAAQGHPYIASLTGTDVSHHVIHYKRRPWIAVTLPELANPFQFSLKPIRRPPPNNAQVKIPQRLEQDRLSQLSLVWRSDMTRGTRVHHPSGLPSVAPKAISVMASLPQLAPQPPHERHQLMAEFIRQKREIYLFQLFLNTKGHKIRRFERQAVAEERQLVEAEQRLEEEKAQHKRESAEIDAARAESAAQERSQCWKLLQKLEGSVAMIHSQTTKNEDTLETYGPYQEFLKKIETEMDRMILLCERVSPDFLSYKQTMRERERRE
jgi:hypothetical protein